MAAAGAVAAVAAVAVAGAADAEVKCLSLYFLEKEWKINYKNYIIADWIQSNDERGCENEANSMQPSGKDPRHSRLLFDLLHSSKRDSEYL